MPSETVNALPRKRFFTEMFSRDITLEDCALDLIDNSIDALLRFKKINIATDLTALLKPAEVPKNLPEIVLNINNEKFLIEDNCGGIPTSLAKDHVFNFGHEKETEQSGQLGVYGIGMKRALFKIGDVFKITSKTKDDGFEVTEQISEWVKKDDVLDDWKFHYQECSAAKTLKKAGTKIEITKLHDEVLMRLKDGSFDSQLRNIIATTYALFLENDVRVRLNGKVIKPYQIPFGSSKVVTPSNVLKKYDGVNVRLLASLSERDPATQQWKAEKAGWYIFCNKRMVVQANKTDLTGWGGSLLPAWHSKFRGFIGLAFFYSDNPIALPWTTTKRGINREAKVFQMARTDMQKAAKPVINFLNNMYPGEERGEIQERAIAESIKTADLFSVSKRTTDFITKNHYCPVIS